LHERDAEYKLLGMPDCVTLLTKFGSVGCLLVGIAQPIVSDPQQRAARKESNVRFISPDGMFAFEYPKSLIRCETDPKQADRWTPARSCEAVIPVCAYASLTKDATVVCIAYRAETLIGTNFEAAAFSVNKLDETTADECLRVTEPHPATSHKEKVNGVTLDVFDVGGVAAGSVLVARLKVKRLRNEWNGRGRVRATGRERRLGTPNLPRTAIVRPNLRNGCHYALVPRQNVL